MALAVVALAVASTGTWAGEGEINLWYGVKDLDLKNQTSDFQSSIGSDFDFGPSAGGPDTFNDLDSQSQFGLMTSWGLDWPVALAVDLFYATSDANVSYSGQVYYDSPGRGEPLLDLRETAKIDYTTWEIDLGIRKYWGGKVQFLMGGGLAIAAADVEADVVLAYRPSAFPTRGISIPSTEAFTDSASKTDFGLWADIGFVWRAGNHFNLGAEVRYSSVNVDLQFSDEPNDAALRFPAGGLQYGVFVGGRW